MEEYVEIIKDASLFMIIAEMILQLVPSAEYDKYLRFLLDLICIMILFLPILDHISGREVKEYVIEIQSRESVLEEEIGLWEERIGNMLAEDYLEQEADAD